MAVSGIIGARDGGAVRARTLVLWTFAFILWGIARQKVAGLSLQDALLQVGLLEVVEVAVIIRLARAIRSDDVISPWAALAAMAFIATMVLVLRFRPSYASGGLELGLLALSIAYPSIRLAATAMTLFVFQYLFMTGPFLWLHEAVGSFDATVVRSILAELGYRASGFGPFVFLEGSTHGVNVMGTCSSSNVVGTMVAGYGILVLGLRGRFDHDDAMRLALLLAAGLVVNWARLAPTALSLEQHAFWHDDFGASVVSLLLAGLVIGAAYLPRRERRTA